MSAQDKIVVGFIDPQKKTISKISIENDLQKIYKLLNCEIIEAVPLHNVGQTERYVICDENGRLHEGKKYFTQIHDGPSIVFCGKLLLVGENKGDFTDCPYSIDDMKEIVEFKDDEYEDILMPPIIVKAAR